MTHFPVGANNQIHRHQFLVGLVWFLAALVLLIWAPTAHAQVRVIRGPTPIPGGDARAAGDLTVENDRLAFALAIQSPPPYGVPRGALVDLAPVSTAGVIGHDRVAFADFIPNNWSAWPNRKQKVSIVKDTPQEAVIEAVRDWSDVTITTVYTLKAGEDRVHLQVTMYNGGKALLSDLRSGVTLWPSAGYLFGVPGFQGLEDGPAKGALSNRVVAYDEDWAIALHAPYLDHIGYSSKDLYQTHTLKPGESRTFEAWLQVMRSGDLAPVTAAEISQRHLPSGVLSGVVKAANGKPVVKPVVVIEKAGKLYAWTIGDARGRYRIALPVGAYTAYATAKAWSRTQSSEISLKGGSVAALDFGGLQPPGKVQFHVSRQGSNTPLDARIVIDQGEKPAVEFLGRRTFFTELDRRGEAEFALAPGDYAFAVSWGRNFLGQAASIKATIVSGRTAMLAVPISMLFDPRARGWYAADLHHHADRAEAVTPAPDMARSQLAAGLDLLFVSDHDSLANLKPLQAIADRLGVPFIAGVEISTSWAHFNAYPVKLDAELAIDTSNTTVGAVFAEARRLGAEIIQVNHPFIPYGYFASLAAGVAPGGFDPAFDLVEINAADASYDDKVLKSVWDFWNAGQRHYLAGGSDVHDVWNEISGGVRTYAHVDEPLTPGSFVRALKAGHAYVTYGPLIFPDQMFGDTVKIGKGHSLALGFDLQAVAGLKHVSLISQGVIVETRDLSSSGRVAHVSFTPTVDGAIWYALVVEDAAGRRAYTNPIWAETSEQ